MVIRQHHQSHRQDAYAHGARKGCRLPFAPEVLTRVINPVCPFHVGSI